MNTNTKEPNLNEMEQVNGGSTIGDIGPVDDIARLAAEAIKFDDKQ